MNSKLREINLYGDLDILRRSADRLKVYGEKIEDHSVVTMALHLLDNIERLKINYNENDF